MKKQIIFLIASLSAFSGSVLAQQTISVTVKSASKAGTVHVSLCKDSDDFLKNSLKEGTATIGADGTTTLTFASIPKGDYAVRMYQDVNNDGKANTGMFGMPKEPFGFSNNPSVSFGPPSFDKAKFTVGDQPVAITVRMLNVN